MKLFCLFHAVAFIIGAPADVWNNPVAKCTEELLLLVDLGRISHGVQEFYNTQSHMLMFRHCSQHIMVVAHSSGKGVYFDRSTLQSAVFSNSLNSLLKFHCITFYPFNDEEVTVFFEHYGTPQVEMEFIKSLTNYNPLLMESIVKKTSQLECIAAVGYVTNSYFLYISRRLLKPSYTFELSIKFLMQSQSNDKILTANEEAILQSSFLAQENLLYVNEISLNFPCLYHQLLDLLITSVKLPVSDMEARLVRSIRGYLFEVALSKKLFHNTLEIEYFKPAHQRKAEVSVHIASVEYLITDLYTIRESCLFMLKPSHEVIDAALLTPQHELLLIQISLVGYVRHESKAHHLRTRKIITGETILQYYKRISGIVDPDKVIYVYLTVSRNETVTKAKPERGAATDDNRFCVGVVKPKSQSSAMIDLSEGRISL